MSRCLREANEGREEGGREGLTREEDVERGSYHSRRFFVGGKVVMVLSRGRRGGVNITSVDHPCRASSLVVGGEGERQEGEGRTDQRTGRFGIEPVGLPLLRFAFSRRQERRSYTVCEMRGKGALKFCEGREKGRSVGLESPSRERSRPQLPSFCYASSNKFVYAFSLAFSPAGLGRSNLTSGMMGGDEQRLTRHGESERLRSSNLSTRLFSPPRFCRSDLK